jgi:hypothetical protein
MSLEHFGCMPLIAHRMDRARGTVNDATAWAGAIVLYAEATH